MILPRNKMKMSKRKAYMEYKSKRTGKPYEEYKRIKIDKWINEKEENRTLGKFFERDRACFLWDAKRNVARGKSW